MNMQELSTAVPVLQRYDDKEDIKSSGWLRKLKYSIDNHSLKVIMSNNSLRAVSYDALVHQEYQDIRYTVNTKANDTV
jgi:outer membrane receptor for Fe3+-dicitrate